jgi:hypothetical protein
MLARAGGNDVKSMYLTAVARRRLSWLFFVAASIVVAAPSGAWADPKIEKEAQALQKKAIEEDNLNVNYAGAVKKLQTAIAKCDGDKCNTGLKAALNRDLGAMQVLNGSVDEGKASFATALGLDPSIELDPAYKNPQLEGIFAEVKKKGGGAAAGGGGGAPLKPGPQPSGDFVHSPPTEAQVRTPLPVYVEYSGSEELARVTVKYKGFGMPDWRTIELKKSDSGFGALIPCKDVTQGMMQYYIQGFNAGNDPVANSGSKTKPFTVPVSSQITGPAPSLPGEEPPAQCADSGECPPDFPGCGGKKKAGGEECAKDSDCDSNSCMDEKCVDKKSVGDDCSKDDECNSGTCSSGKCAGKKGEGEECEADEDCDSGHCKDDKCTASTSGRGKLRRVWVGVSLQADLYFLKSADNVCQVVPLKNSMGQNNANAGSPVNTQGYFCVDGNGNLFPNGGVTLKDGTKLSGSATNGDIVSGVGDQVVGGISPLQNIRLLLSFDYALNQNMMLGARAGLVLGTAPTNQAFSIPLHLEARFTYLFGKNALTSVIAPYAFLGLGAGEFDAKVPVTVHLNVNGTDNKGTENAWTTGGPVFFALGAGLRFGLGSRVALTAALKFEGALGGTAGFLPGLAPELGVAFGF